MGKELDAMDRADSSQIGRDSEHVEQWTGLTITQKL